MPSVVLVCSLSRVLDRSVCLLIYPFQDTLTNTKNKPFVHMKRVQFCVYFKVFCRIIHKKSFLVTLMQRKDYSILASSIGGEKVKLTNDRCNKSIPLASDVVELCDLYSISHYVSKNKDQECFKLKITVLILLANLYRTILI